MNIKGLQHETQWLNYAKLEHQLQERNATPTRFLPDGTPVYTVPTIHDHSTNTTISDSQQILHYLDDAYPDTPKLCTSPYPYDDFIKAAFESTWSLPLSTVLLKGIWGLMVPITVANLDEASGMKYKQRYEAKSGAKFESLLEGSKQRELKEQARESFNEADRQLEEMRRKYGGDGPWLLGKEIKIPDLAVASSLAYIAAMLGEDSELWQNIMEWDGGRWADRWENFKPYHRLY